MDVYEAVTTRRSVRGFIDKEVPRDMSIGYEDAAVEYVRTGRAPLGETITFVGD